VYQCAAFIGGSKGVYAIDFQELSCSKILKVLGRWFGRNPFSKGFLPKSVLFQAVAYSSLEPL
jgi:hypothetical protein